jgi:hypothetical protein
MFLIQIIVLHIKHSLATFVKLRSKPVPARIGSHIYFAGARSFATMAGVALGGALLPQLVRT